MVHPNVVTNVSAVAPLVRDTTSLRVSEPKDVLALVERNSLGEEDYVLVESPAERSAYLASVTETDNSPHSLGILEDIRLLKEEPARDNILDIIGCHSLIVPQQVDGLLSLDLLHCFRLLLDVTLEQVLFVIYHISSEPSSQDQGS